MQYWSEGEKRFILIEAPLTDQWSGMAMIKLLDLKTVGINNIKVLFIRNVGLLDVTNNFPKQLIFSKNELLGILHLRSIAY